MESTRPDDYSPAQRIIETLSRKVDLQHSEIQRERLEITKLQNEREILKRNLTNSLEDLAKAKKEIKKLTTQLKQRTVSFSDETKPKKAKLKKSPSKPIAQKPNDHVHETAMEIAIKAARDQKQ